MTTAILLNAILAVAILATIVGMKIWAIRTQHHDHAVAADRPSVDRPTHRHLPRAHMAHREGRHDERRSGSVAPAQS